MQVSDQCVKLVKAGWFDQQQEPSGVSTLTDPKVSSKHTASKAEHLTLQLFAFMQMHAIILSTTMLMQCSRTIDSAVKPAGHDVCFV